MRTVLEWMFTDTCSTSGTRRACVTDVGDGWYKPRIHRQLVENGESHQWQSLAEQ